MTVIIFFVFEIQMKTPFAITTYRVLLLCIYMYIENADSP